MTIYRGQRFLQFENLGSHFILSPSITGDEIFEALSEMRAHLCYAVIIE